MKILLTIALLAIADSETRKPNRVINGNNADPGEFPWQASIRLGGKHVCGAAIIGKRHVLTAAHCIVDQVKAPYSGMTVVTGTNTLKPLIGKTHRVNNVTIHENYVARNWITAVQNDIAVIGLLKEIEEDEFQRPISLPTSDILNGAEGIFSGFGYNAGKTPDSTRPLQKLDVVIKNFGACRGALIKTNQICVIKEPGQCTAKGDSGSPVIRKAPKVELVGILSTAAPCEIRRPDVFTKVYSYLDFIKMGIAST